jgi:hypothetical protein
VAFFFFLAIAKVFGVGNAVYIAQAAAGANDGTSCANAKIATYFNTIGNWSATPSGIQIGPDTIVHLCGVISTTLTAQGNGSSGHPVIILFETGAKLSQAVCPATGCLNLDSHTDFTVDGGGAVDAFGHLQTTNGIIESTANGSSLANQVAASRCAEADSSTRVTFQNILVQNCYVHVVSPLDTAPSAPDPTAIHAAGAITFKVLHSIIHDANWAVYTGNGVGPVEVGWTEMYNIDHGLAVGVVTESFVGVTFHDNRVHDPVNWDTTLTACGGNPCYHHDGVHLFKTSTGHINSIAIYNNVFDGDWGQFTTAQVYNELSDGDETLYNNVFIGTGGSGNRNLTNGLLSCTVGSSGTCKVYNNTFLASSAQGAANITIEGVNADYRNNLVSGGAALWAYKTGLTFVANGFDYNQFVNGSGLSYYNPDLGFRTYAQINTLFGGANSHSTTSATLGVTATGVPLTGAPLIGAGTNLSSFSITTLNSDTSAGASRTPQARSGFSAWDIGAYNSSLTPTNPPAPAPVVVAQVQAVPLPSTTVPQPTISSVSPTKTYVTKNGCSQDGAKWLNPCQFRVFCTGCSASTVLMLDGVVVSQSFVGSEMDASVPLSALPIPSVITTHSFSATNPATPIPILQ